MREIKFRAWEISKKRMLDCSQPLGVSFDGDICSTYTDSLYDSDSNSIKEIDLILMQYTGLKDNNGKEIFQGDVVKFESYGCRTLSVVKWGFVGWEPFMPTQQEHGGSGPYNQAHCEVIGNICENPELIRS